MSPNDHDFDWVQAQQDCSLAVEYAKLRHHVKACVKQCQPADGLHYADTPVGFSVILDLGLPRTPPQEVVFTMEDDSIIIVKKPGDRSYTVKLTLNHDGECRYKINGEGEYLRWQVARKVIEPMFF